jgi:signal transduction histidine kinase
VSYRSIRDILGETSLERKIRFLFGLCMFALIAGSFWWYGSRTEQLVFSSSRATARHVVDAIMLQHHWKMLEKEQQHASTIESLEKRLLSERYQWRFLRPDASPEEAETYRKLDRRVLEYFVDESPVSPGQPLTDTAGRFECQDFRTDDNAEYHYYQPIRFRKDCAICHEYRGPVGGNGAGRQKLAEGDLMAVIKLVMPDAATRKAINTNRAILLATGIVTAFLAMFVAYAIIRYVIVKPLEHLRDVADEVRRGNTDARADIHTADEFEELGVAFNRMLRGLLDTQDEIRKTNSTLDDKVDELAQVNLQLYESNRLKGDFLATMSHELRTPLNSIIGFSDVLGSIDSLDAKQRRYVENIRTSGRMLLEMINDILDLAKIEAGKMEVRLATFRVEAVVSAQCDMVRPLAEKRNIQLSYDVAPGLDEVVQDQAKVQQILANLLSNAIKFTPEGGRVGVHARPAETSPGEPPEFVLDVVDTGVGIAVEDQQAIFEKFRQGDVFRRDDAMTREFSGTGLGLSIVRELCRLLGGDVTLESQLGRGSRFTVRLPMRLELDHDSDAAAGATRGVA